MAAPGRLLPEDVAPPAGGALDTKGSIFAFLAALKCVELPALATRCWLLPLADGAKVFIFEETLGPENFACDCCRIVGWQGHPVSTKNWHFIVPAEEGQYSLADPTSLCAIADARARGLQGSAHVALPAPDPDAPHHHQASSIFESKMHRLHGTVHSNGYGHLMRLNGREGGSKRASGRQLMQLWDDLCEMLRVRQVSTEDVSNKAGMELRVLHTAARRMTWYGQWHYGFGRGGFNMSPQQWQAAIDYVHSAPVEDVLADFDGIDATVLDILQRYRDTEATATNGERETLGHLLGHMLSLLSKPDPILPVFEAAAAAEREQQRMVAEQRMLMAAYYEQQRQLAVQQAQHPLDLANGPTAAYFGVSQQQQELQRQQQELFALACQPVAAAQAQLQQVQRPATPTIGALALAAPAAQQPAAQQQLEQQQQLQPMETDEGALPASASVATASMATDPEGEAAAPSGEPELRAAAATEKAAAEAADEELALARATAQAAIAAAVRAVDGHAPGSPRPAPVPAAASAPAPGPLPAEVPPLTAEQVAAALAAQQIPAPVPPAAVAAVPGAVPALAAAQLAAPPAAACLSPPPPPPLPASAAAAAADEVDQWLASYSSDSDGGKEAGGSEGLGAVAGTLHCRRAAGAGEPSLADADEALPPAVADGGVLRLRGGGSGSRKRPASTGGGSDGGDAAKRQHVGGDGAAGEPQRFGAEVVGRSLMVYWKEQKTYYTGTITKYHPDSGKHTVLYRDGDKETLELHKERFKWSERDSVHVPPAPPKEAKEAKPPRKTKTDKEKGDTPAAEAGAEDRGETQAGKRGRRAGSGSRKSSVQDELPEAAASPAAAAAAEEEPGRQPKAAQQRARGKRAQKEEQQEQVKEEDQQQEQQGGAEHAAGRHRRSRTEPMPEEHPTRQLPRRRGPASPAPLPEGADDAARQQHAEQAAAAAAERDSEKAEARAAMETAAEARAAEVAAKVAAKWKYPHIPPPSKPLGGASLRAYIKRQEGLLGLTPGSSAAATLAPQPAAQAAAAAAAAAEPHDEDAAAAAAVAAAAVARAVQADQPAAERSSSPPPAPAAPEGAAAPVEAEAAAAAEALAAPAEAEADAAAAPMEHDGGAAAAADAAAPAAGAQAAATQETTLTTEQLAAAAARQPKQRTKEGALAEAAAGKLVLGCGSCRYATGGCKRCRPRIVKELDHLGIADARLGLLGECGRCGDPQHGCPVCWRMTVLAGDHAEASRLFEEAKAVAEAAAAAAGADAPPAPQPPARGKRKQAAAAEEAPEEQPEQEQPAKKQHAAEVEASPGPAEEEEPAEAAAADTPAAGPEDEPGSPEAGSTAGGRQRKQKGGSTDGKQLVDEAVKAEVNAARARGEILLGCGRCRYRTGAGCVDCRHKALLQMRQENLTEGLELVGCAECSGSDQGCRHCWPAAVAAAQRQRSSRPAEQRQPPPEKPQQQQQKAPPAEAKVAAKPPKAPKAVPSPAGVRGLKEAAAAAAAGGSPATAAQLAAAAAAGAGSASSRRNKALLAVNREATMAAHEAGKYALGCGRCRWSMTGGCNNCRSKLAEEMRKHHPEWASRLGCEHCEGSKDGCPYCWKEVLAAMGDLAVRQPPADKVEAAIKYIPTLDELEEDAEAAEDRVAQPKPHKRQRGDKFAKQPQQPKQEEEAEEQQAQVQLQGAAAAAAAPLAAAPKAKWGSKVEKCPIRIWWPADNTFYGGVVTSYKQGLHRVLYDEDGHAERLNLLEHRFQVQLLHGGPWLEYDRGVPADETSRLAAVAASAMPATAGPVTAAPGQPVEQPLGVPVKALLQKRVRVLCSDVGQWKAGVVVGYNHGKFVINFDDGSKGRFFLQYEQWEPLDLDLLEQRQQAQRAAAQEAAAAATAAAAAAGAPRQRAQRAAASLPPGGYGNLFDEQGELEHAGLAAGQLAAPPPVPGAATGLPPPASLQPRTVEQLPEPLPLSPEGEKARKVQYKFGQHRYVGQRVRLWLEEVQDWKEGVITSFGQNRHKVQFYDGTKGSFNMQTDAYQLLPQPGSPAEPGPVVPPAAAPAALPAEPAGPPASSTRRGGSGGMPPKGVRPPSGGPPILPPDALPVFRDRLQPNFVLPTCTQPFTLDKITHVLRLTLARLKDYPGQWVPKSYLRHYLNASGVRDNSLMDYCGKSLECVTLDGWAVYRNRSPQYNCLYYLAEKVGDDTVLTDIAEPMRAESLRRGPRKVAGDPATPAEAATPVTEALAVAPAPAPEQREQREQRVIPTRATAVHHQAPPPQQRPQRRFAGYNVRRGGGALSPRTTVAGSSGPRRQQPWQMLLPAGVPPTPLTPEQCRHQVMADLVYLFNNVLRQYKPAAYVEVQKQAVAAVANAAEQAPLRVVRMDRLQHEVQVLRDCKHFIKLGSGERFGELPTPAGMLRLLCHIRMPEESPEDENGDNEPAWAPPVRPPPEIVLLPADATVGQLLAAATAAFRESYRMCASWTADCVVGGLSVAVPPPPAPLPALPAPQQAEQVAGEAMDVDGGALQEPAAAGAAAGAEAEAMDVDAAPAVPAAAAAAAADPEAQLAAAVAAAAVAAVLQEHDGSAAAAEAGAVGQATQQLAAVQLDQPQAQQGAQQLSDEEQAQRTQQEQQRAALLATRLADVLLPPAQQQEQQEAAGAGAAPATGSATAAAAEAAAQLPSVVVDGHGLDWAIRWRHAGGLEDWEVRCRCGVHDDDGERMIMCDTCNIWQHTRCYHIADDQPVPEHQFTCDTCRARGVAAQHP
ncbi:hypothetical protein ABPG75_010113 [Micractinium tetrahymenae]